MNKTKREYTYIDVLRIIACFFVVFNHTAGFHYYLTEAYNPSIWFHICLSAFTKMAVPIFFMISGMLLLGKQEPLGAVYGKRVVKAALLLVSVTALDYLRCIIAGKIEGSIADFLQKLISGTMRTEFWFMYAYIGFLMLLPFLRAMVANLKSSDYKYLFALHVVFASIIPIIRVFLQDYRLSSSFSLPIVTSQILFFPLLGYYVGKIMDTEKMTWRKPLLWVGLASLGMLVTAAVTLYTGTSGAYTQGYITLFDYVIAIALFLAVKYICSLIKFNDILKKIIAYCGSLTLGVYLLHPIFLQTGLVFKLYPSNMNTVRAAAVFSLAMVILCAVLTMILKEIKNLFLFLVKKIFRPTDKNDIK